jgi:hypothetical protein
VAVFLAGELRGGGAMSEFAEFNPEQYRRPFGPNAPWNVPVHGLPRHPRSDVYAERLWSDAPSHHPGNFNLTFDGYTYPVYYASEATGRFPVRTRRWKTPLDGTEIPWNPAWQPATGTDAQIILLDRQQGREWDLWQVRFDGETVTVSNGNLVPGDYRTREDGFGPSRGCGIPYLAMLVRPEEIMLGEVRHALSMPIRNTDGELYVAPATKLEHPDRPGGGIPEGMRFALHVTDQEIEEWVRSLPAELPDQTRRSARVIAVALRDYGWFITDTSGGAHLQFEDRITAEEKWQALGLADSGEDWPRYPQDLLDGLMTRERIYALVPSDEYPEDRRASASR